MLKLGIMCQKGGSGKTTIALHLAVAANEGGESVVLVDTDPQGSASAWGRVRPHDAPIVATSAVADLPAVFGAAAASKSGVIVVDTAPHAAPEAFAAAKAMDMILIPCRPSALDIVAMMRTVSIIRAAKARAAFVLSACPFRARETPEARRKLAEFGLPVFPGQITDRRAFARAVSSGASVTEFEPHGEAAREIRELWAWVKEQQQ